MVLSSSLDWELAFAYHSLKTKKTWNWVYFLDFLCIGMEQVWKDSSHHSLHTQAHNLCHEL